MKTFVEIATEIGELVTEKNLAYGSSFARAGEFLALLYPAGLRPEQYGDALLLVRMFDKMMRIATDRDALGESPFLDLSGYGILGAHMHQQKEGRGECLENASGENAWSRSKEQRDSARPGAEPRTLPNDGAGIASDASPLRSSCSARPTSAPVASATGDASASAADRLRFPRLNPLHRALIKMFQLRQDEQHSRDQIKCYLRSNCIAFTLLRDHLDQLIDLGFIKERVAANGLVYRWRLI